MLFAAILYSRMFKIPLGTFLSSKCVTRLSFYLPGSNIKPLSIAVMSYHTHLPVYGKNYLGFIPGIEEFSWSLLRYAHSRADLTLVTSPQMKQELEENGIQRVAVWRKGIDTERFHPSFRSVEMRHKMTNGNPDDFLMVYVGRLGAEKRLKDIKGILEKMPNARLCIVGAGPQRQELEEWFQGTNTVFTGQIKGDDLSSAFASADVFCMPSDSETLGFVVLESMASGVPVVAANAGGIPDIIDDERTSFLVPPGDIDAFVTRMQQLENKEFRDALGKEARAEAERWGWESATSVLRNVQYEKAILNFHSRAFGGFGRQRTKGILRLFRLQFAWFVAVLKKTMKGVGSDLLPSKEWYYQ